MPNPAMPAPLRMVAQSPARRYMLGLHRALYGRPFSGKTSRRLLVLHVPTRVPYASVYPFVMYSRAFADRFDVEVRLYPTKDAVEGGIPRRLSTATHVLGISWLTQPEEWHRKVAELLFNVPDRRVTGYLDSSANADIRLAVPFADAEVYFKKSLFTQRAQHLQPTRGHTNLEDYYGPLYGQTPSVTDWQVPARVLPKLHLAPNFLTAPNLAQAFLAAPGPPEGPRDIDLHARLGGIRHTGWYGAMRRAAEAAATGVPGMRTVTGTGVPRDRFMAELCAAKMCFSPFGFGELCWRDIEAILSGAVLLKPDMGHLDTTPNLYRDGETYVALKWDFSDLAEKATALAADPELRMQIARNAYAVARDYLVNDGPVDTFAPLFGDVA